MSRKFLTPIRFLVSASDPSFGVLGDTYFNSTDKSIRIYNGDYWVTIMKSDDPTPFYMHTHNYDGEVDSVLPIPLTVGELGGEGYLEVDGGTVTSTPTHVPGIDTNIDGGTVL